MKEFFDWVEHNPILAFLLATMFLVAFIALMSTLTNKDSGDDY